MYTLLHSIYRGSLERHGDVGRGSLENAQKSRQSVLIFHLANRKTFTQVLGFPNLLDLCLLLQTAGQRICAWAPHRESRRASQLNSGYSQLKALERFPNPQSRLCWVLGECTEHVW